MESYQETLMAVVIAYLIVVGIITIFITICKWILYDKAGEPGWAAIIPVYATIIQLKIAGKPISWIIWLMQFWVFYIIYYLSKFSDPFEPHPISGLLLFFSVIVYLVFYIMTLNGMSKSFGKDAGFTVGLFFLGFIFYPILAFGSSKFIGPGGVRPDDNITPNP